MAKRPPLENPFARTEPEGQEPEEAPKKSGRGRPRKREYRPDEPAPIGIGLTFEEGERLAVMAEELNVNRHELLLYIVRDFMSRFESGWRPPTETKTVLKK